MKAATGRSNRIRTSILVPSAPVRYEPSTNGTNELRYPTTGRSSKESCPTVPAKGRPGLRSESRRRGSTSAASRSRITSGASWASKAKRFSGKKGTFLSSACDRRTRPHSGARAPGVRARRDGPPAVAPVEGALDHGPDVGGPPLRALARRRRRLAWACSRRPGGGGVRRQRVDRDRAVRDQRVTGARHVPASRPVDV